MITRTFITKANTIADFSKENFGLNPICSLTYGAGVSRILLYFDEKALSEKVSDGTYKNANRLTHRLKMFNCGSVDSRKFFETGDAIKYMSNKHRAASFDVIAFKVPQPWDAGTGFDNSTDVWFVGYKSVSEDGSTWEKSMNGIYWDTPGIYSSSALTDEYNKWGDGEPSVVIGRQHFDYGNENLDIDITDFVNDIISGKEKNYGICLAFSPLTEETRTDGEKYINFFTNNTNTFFQPYIESRYEADVNDARYKFFIGKKNRLFFYSIINGEFVDLDTLPTCEINGQEYPVSSDTKGIYYTEVKLPRTTKENTIFYDTWGNLVLDGEQLENVEMEFVALSPNKYYNFGGAIEDNEKLSPIIAGINDDQKLSQGDIRELIVYFRKPYSSSEYDLVDESYYRIYVKDGSREIDVIDWDKIDSVGRHNSFVLNTAELIPQDYYVDIKAKLGRETLIFKNKLHFRIVDNTTELKK